MHHKLNLLYLLTRAGPVASSLTFIFHRKHNFMNPTDTDMPTFENQKEESLTTEARRADNRGPTIEAQRADKLKSS